jgi:hypothetical protein
MAIMGLDDDKKLGKRKPLVDPHRIDGLDVEGLSSDEDFEIYTPEDSLGKAWLPKVKIKAPKIKVPKVTVPKIKIGASKKKDTKTTTVVSTDASKATAAANAAKTKETFTAMQKQVDTKTAAKAAAQETAKANAIAQATAEGKSQSEIDAAAKAAVTKVALEQPIIVGTSDEEVVEEKPTTILQQTSTGPMIVTKTDPFSEFKANWDKGWNEFVAGFKKTLNIK